MNPSSSCCFEPAVDLCNVILLTPACSTMMDTTSAACRCMGSGQDPVRSTCSTSPRRASAETASSTAAAAASGAVDSTAGQEAGVVSLTSMAARAAAAATGDGCSGDASAWTAVENDRSETSNPYWMTSDQRHDERQVSDPLKEIYRQAALVSHSSDSHFWTLWIKL